MRSGRLEARLRSALGGLTEAEQRISEHLVSDASLIGFSTAASASRKLGVSEATLIRFARTLGYESFTEFQRDIKQEIQEVLSEPTTARLGQAKSYPHDRPFTTLQRTVETDLGNLHATLERTDPDRFDKVIGWLAKARRVVVIGFRASEAPAAYLGYLLNFVRPGAEAIHRGAEVAFDRLLDIDERDVAVVITLSRPSLWVAEVADYLKSKLVPIVLITDALLSPLSEFSDEMFVVGSQSTGHVQSYTATICMCGAMANALALSAEMVSAERLSVIEDAFSARPVWGGRGSAHRSSGEQE